MLNLKKKNLKSDSGGGVLLSLKKYKEPHKKRKMIYFLSALMILSLGIFIFYKSFAFYEEKKDFNVINGVVEDPGDLYFAYYVNNTITREFPTKDSGLTLDTTKSSCNSGVTVSWDDEKWQANLNYSNYQKNSTTRTKCTLYFTKKVLAGKDVLTYVKNNADSSSTEVYTVPDKKSDSCTYTLAYDGTSDNNLRYVGKNPCNYVTFNGEKAGWRIIGILKTPEGQRLKLIRYMFLKPLPWDLRVNGDSEDYSAYQFSNDWTTSSLKTLLNEGAYYNRTTGTYVIDSEMKTLDFTNDGLLEETKNQIDTITWPLGGTADYEEETNGLTKHFYEYERSGNVYENQSKTWQGKVGLMYPSDYGYATSGGNTLSRQTCLNTPIALWDKGPTVDESECAFNDWLSGAYWTLTPSSGSSYEVFRTTAPGGLTLASVPDEYGYVRPTVYLKANITILSGEGTKDSPYVLGLE